LQLKRVCQLCNY